MCIPRIKEKKNTYGHTSLDNSGYNQTEKYTFWQSSIKVLTETGHLRN